MEGYTSRGERSRDTSECNSIEFSADDDNSQGNNDRTALDKFFTLENGSNKFRNKENYGEEGEQRYDTRFYEHHGTLQPEELDPSAERPTSFVDRVRRNSETASAYSSAYSGYHSSGAASDGGYESPTSASHQNNEPTLPPRHREGPRKYLAERDDSSREDTPAPFNSSRAEYHLLSWHRLGDNSEYTGDHYSPPYADLSHTKKSSIDSRFPLNCNASYPCSSTMSEAAKSDIATVCSGSVLDDTDLVSVLSGDLNASAVDGANFKLTTGTFSRFNAGSTTGLSSTAGSGVGGLASSSLHCGVPSRRNELLTVEFALERHGSPATISSHLNLHDQHLTSFSGNHSLTSRSDGGSTDAFGGISSTNDMGPPLSRELMGFRFKSGPGSANSVASSKGALSDGFSYGVYTPDDTACAIAEMDFHSVQSAGPLSTIEGSEGNYADNQSQTSMEQKMQAMGLQMKEGSEGQNIFIDSSHDRIHRTDFERTPGRSDFRRHCSGRPAAEQKLDRPYMPKGRTRAGAHRRSRSRSWSRSRSRSPENCHTPWSARGSSKSPERQLHQACNHNNRYSRADKHYRYHIHSSREWERSRLHTSAGCSNSIYYPHQRTSFRLPMENNERFFHASNDTRRGRNVEYPSR
jgi:hypothetical protein